MCTSYFAKLFESFDPSVGAIKEVLASVSPRISPTMFKPYISHFYG